jgi:nucleoside-diphosphate-sugar epimerase
MLGRALVRRLSEFGEPLRLLVRKPPATPPGDKIQLIYGDLGDPATVDRALQGIDLVFHLGAAMRGGIAEFASGTVWGTRNIVDACERNGVRKLVYVSSMTVLHNAGHLPDAPITEKFPYEPFAARRGLYSQTKLEAERTVLQAADENRIHAVVLRPGQIYGPGAEKAPPAGAITMGGRWVVVGSGAHYVPLVYIENVVDALMLAAQKELPNGAIFQLVDPEGIRQKEYVAWVRRSGRPVRASYVPAWLLKGVGLGVVALSKVLRRPPPLSPYRVSSITPLWPCDCTAAHTQLGWVPRVSIQEGLAITFPPEAGKR